MYLRYSILVLWIWLFASQNDRPCEAFKLKLRHNQTHSQFAEKNSARGYVKEFMLLEIYVGT
jgi:hypothetical protein